MIDWAAPNAGQLGQGRGRYLKALLMQEFRGFSSGNKRLVIHVVHLRAITGSVRQWRESAMELGPTRIGGRRTSRWIEQVLCRLAGVDKRLKPRLLELAQPRKILVLQSSGTSVVYNLSSFGTDQTGFFGSII